MSLLTLEEGKLLADLNKPDCRTIGRPRILEMLGIVQKCQQGVAEARQEQAAATIMANGIFLAAAGKLTEDEINNARHVSLEQKADLLAVVQMRYYAEAYLQLMGLEPASPLPTVASPIHDTVYSEYSEPLPAPISADSAIHDAERIG